MDGVNRSIDKGEERRKSDGYEREERERGEKEQWNEVREQGECKGRERNKTVDGRLKGTERVQEGAREGETRRGNERGDGEDIKKEEG